MAWKTKLAKGYGLGKGMRSPCVVVNQSPQHGINMWGPFVTDADAHAWMHENLESELLSMYETVNTPGMINYVTYMMQPSIQVWTRDKERTSAKD